MARVRWRQAGSFAAAIFFDNLSDRAAIRSYERLGRSVVPHFKQSRAFSDQILGQGRREVVHAARMITVQPYAIDRSLGLPNHADSHISGISNSFAGWRVGHQLGPSFADQHGSRRFRHLQNVADVVFRQVDAVQKRRKFFDEPDALHEFEVRPEARIRLSELMVAEI